MTERIKDLLDEAVSRVEPRTLDPAAAVARRRRAQRRRTLVAGGFAVLAVLAGGGLVVPQLQKDPPVPVAVPDRPLPVPHFADGVLVSGGLRLPVPPGWQAATETRDRSCADSKRTILIADRLDGIPEDTAPACRLAAITVSVRDEEMSAPARGLVAEDGLVAAPPISMTLPGGEPAWLSNRISAADTIGGAYDLHLVLPWSRTTVFFRMSLADTQRILATIRTEPIDAGRLLVPDVPAVAELIAPDQDSVRHGKTTETAKIFEVVRVLRDQTKAVPDNKACAGPAQKGLRLDIGTAHVVVALGPHCQEAVSSLGGRVHFSNDAVTELETLFGIEK
ncbi:hypothetical protein M1L60_26395 [Actinoplanes sp. TRM 88003]|uniref:Uncharacterized protein n=1 Tax=Paractinoplanes aksuensis TaxID=2939490 RepID=A0ABT1DWX8_9ACTN|nr:hypothetical protein [Actinoplanes aksuensis]MCO8274136.1 hypothetical protein [Actinoplanes aksuensis]